MWVDGRKIVSIGVGVRRWVTLHGFAFNVNPDLSHFSLIRPCGFEAERVTSLAQLTEGADSPPPPLGRLAVELVDVFAEVFGMAPVRAKGADLAAPSAAEGAMAGGG